MRNKITKIQEEEVSKHNCVSKIDSLNKKNNVRRRQKRSTVSSFIHNISDNNENRTINTTLSNSTKSSTSSNNSNSSALVHRKMNKNKLQLINHKRNLYSTVKVSNLIFSSMLAVILSFSFFISLISRNNLLVEAQEDQAKDQPLLFCQPNKMFIRITKSYLRKHNIEIKAASQLYFRGHSGCFAQEENNEYILSLFNPFTACGTELEHTSEDYIYTNEVVLDRRDGNGATKLLEMRCVYEDKYIVSSGPITPTKNTLTFTTEYGEFETKMQLYSNSRFDSMAKLDDRPSVQLGDTVYVSVSMFIPFNPDYQNDFTITIKSCFANHAEDHKNMENYHYLISGMCASPDDPTVSIYQNGQYSSTEARFSFDMFKFRKGYGDYIYLHCEVKLCNSTLEICNGESQGEQCNGRALEVESNDERRRRKRSAEANGGFFELTAMAPLANVLRNYQAKDITTDLYDINDLDNQPKSRMKRAIEDDPNAMPDPQDDTLAYLSRGPLVLETPTKENVASKSGLSVSLDEVRREQSFLRLWVFSGVAAVIGIIGILLTAVTIFKRRAERIKLQTNGTVITAPTIAKNNQPSWRQGPLPTIPKNGEET